MLKGHLLRVIYHQVLEYEDKTHPCVPKPARGEHRLLVQRGVIDSPTAPERRESN